MAQVSVQPFYSGRAYYDVTSADGQKYVFVPKEFVEKGFVQNGQQFYSPGFLTPEALTTASAFTLPDDSSLTGAAKSIYQEPTKGFLWKADDFNKINYDDFSIRSYQPNNTYGLIKGYTLKDGVPYYIQEPSPGANYTLLDKDGTSTNTTVTVTQSGGGGGLFGGLFGSLVSGLSSELAKLDPSAAISRELTNLYQPVEKAITAGVEEVSKALSTDDAKKAMAIAAAFYLPGVGAQLGQALVTQGLITGAAIPYATAIGTALASTGASVAQGVPFDTALTNATVNAVTSTGSQSVAGYISKLGASPEVANAVTSVGASGLATAAKGGSAADIERNMTGALAGSTVTGLTGDKLSGAVVGGGITGGTAGAVAPIAGSLIGSALGGGADTAKTGAPPAGTVAVQDASGNTLYTDGQTYYNSDGSINTAATESAGVVSGVGTDVAGPATGMTDKSAPGVSVGGSNLSLGTDSYGYRIPAGTKYENGLTYEGNGQWVFPNGSRMLVGSRAWDDASVKSFDPSKSYVTSFGTFGTSETAGAGTSAGGAGTGGGGGSGAGGGAGGGSSVGGVGGGGAQTSDAQGVGADSAIIDLLGLDGGANVGGNVVVDSGVGAGNVAGNVAIDTGATGNVGNAAGNVVISDAGLGGGANAAVGADTSVSPADRDILILSGITPPGTSTVTSSTATAQPTTVTRQTATPVTFTPATPATPATPPKIYTPAIAIPAVPPAGETDAERTARRNEYIERTIAGEQYYYKKLNEGRGRGNVVVGSGADAGAGNATGNVVISDAGGGGNATSNVVIDTGPGGGNAAGNVIVSDGGLGGGNAAGNVVISDGGLGGGGGNAAGNVIVGPGDGDGGGLGGNVTIDVGGGGGGNATSNVSGNVVVDEPPGDDEKPPVDKVVVEPEYKPEIFIYGGVEPPRRPRPELRTTLQGPFAPSTTLGQALTGYRGAGEIEGKKTGKPRKNVWNEESLRLKDALGL